MPVIYRDSTTWPGTAKQDGAFLLPASMPAQESARTLVALIFGPPYPQILSTTTARAVLRRRQSIGGVG